MTKEIVGDSITAYSYDLAGNRLQMRKFENAQVTNEVDYTLGLGNRLASWGTNGVAMYNTAGCLTNMVSDIDGRELNLGWNSQYQLTSVDVGTTNINYQYNVLGQRISRREITGSTTNVEYYVHDGVNIVADLDQDKELLRSYTYAPGYDSIISMTTYGDETNTYFYIRNHNNSVVALVDEEGDVAESYTYTAYGEVTVFDTNGNELSESALGNRYTFQGREIDWSTGLYNFRARWYDAETGRWLSKDPIGIDGGLNQYVFCGNNPVMFGDPEGLKKYSRKDLEFTYEYVRNGQQVAYECAMYGVPPKDTPFRKTLTDFSIANPYSGSDKPIIHDFERNPWYMFTGCVHAIGQFVNVGDTDRNCWNYYGLVEVWRHEQLLSNIQKELDSLGDVIPNNKECTKTPSVIITQ